MITHVHAGQFLFCESLSLSSGQPTHLFWPTCNVIPRRQVRKQIEALEHKSKLADLIRNLFLRAARPDKITIQPNRAV